MNPCLTSALRSRSALVLLTRELTTRALEAQVDVAPCECCFDRYKLAVFRGRIERRCKRWETRILPSLALRPLKA